jgi:hypothetical protein
MRCRDCDCTNPQSLKLLQSEYMFCEKRVVNDGAVGIVTGTGKGSVKTAEADADTDAEVLGFPTAGAVGTTPNSRGVLTHSARHNGHVVWFLRQYDSKQCAWNV